MTEKIGVGKQVGGFTQQRSGRRPYRVETLLAKEPPRNLDVLDRERKLAKRLTEDAGGEFSKKAEITTPLQPHQQRVVDRLRGQSGLVVAHGLGSGKTLASIAAADELAPGRAVALVPAALQENYRKEMDKHVKGGHPAEVRSLQNAVVKQDIPNADLLILDEAHRLRNPASAGYQQVRDAKTGKRLLLTASPVYNQPEDIAPLVNLAAGGRVLPLGSDFRRAYVRQPGDSLLTVLNPFASTEPKIVHRGDLQRRLQPWVDYHADTDEGYPTLRSEMVEVPMSERQTALHDAAWGQVPFMTKLRLRKSLPPNKQELAELNRFQSQARQISSSEGKFSVDGVAPPSPKIVEAVNRLSSKLESNPRHRGLVYANFLGTLNDYSGELQRRGIPYGEFRGDMPKKLRDQAVRDYNEGKVRALLVSGAGGEGLDLKGTRQVQVLEPHWNEEKLKQVIGRARRYQSHAALPPEEQNVAVENYAAMPRRGLFGKIFKGRAGVETMLYNVSAQKQRLNDQVLALLQKQSADERSAFLRSLRPGDVLLSEFPSKETQEAAARYVPGGVRTVLPMFAGSPVHAALVVGGGKVIHSTAAGVSRVPANTLDGELTVIRPNVATTLRRLAVRRAVAAVGTPYSGRNAFLGWVNRGVPVPAQLVTRDAVTCSGLVADAYREALPKGTTTELVLPSQLLNVLPGEVSKTAAGGPGGRLAGHVRAGLDAAARGAEFLEAVEPQSEERVNEEADRAVVRQLYAAAAPYGVKLPRYLYHGAPEGHDELVNRGIGIHLTPMPALASAFVIPREDVARGRSGKIRNAQQIWSLPARELRKPHSHHVISVLPGRGVSPIVPGEAGAASGYVHKVDTKGLEGQFHVHPGEPREVVFAGRSLPVKSKVPVKVTWETVQDPSIRGGPGRNTFAKSLLKQSTELRPRAGELAPGIPKGRVIRPIPGVPEEGPNPEWIVSLSKHPAAIRGDHQDLRLVDTGGAAHSWALPLRMPEPGESAYAAQQATHGRRYATRTKPFTIPLGVYGGTRPGAQVEPVYVQPAEVVSASDSRVHFLRHHGQETDEFVLRRLGQSGKTPMWALHNVTARRTPDLPESKPVYRSLAPGQVDPANTDQVMTPKLDGAHVLVSFPKTGKPMRVFSYRPTERRTGLIEHTFKFPDFQNVRTPKGLAGTVLRAETWATGPDGRALPAPEVGRLLNSSVPRSRVLQAQGAQLRLTGIDVVKHRGRDYGDASFAEKLEAIRAVEGATGGRVGAPELATTPEEKQALLEAIRSGAHPHTREGVVLQEIARLAPPTKVKFREDQDVYVRGIYSKPRTQELGQAAGFTYSLEPDGPVVGRVGTGLSQQLRAELAQNPERFVGRVAKVESAGRHMSSAGKAGALTGSPAFKEWHIDKTPPELLKSGQEDADALGLINAVGVGRAGVGLTPEELTQIRSLLKSYAPRAARMNVSSGKLFGIVQRQVPGGGQ